MNEWMVNFRFPFEIVKPIHFACHNQAMRPHAFLVSTVDESTFSTLNKSLLCVNLIVNRNQQSIIWGSIYIYIADCMGKVVVRGGE